MSARIVLLIQDSGLRREVGDRLVAEGHDVATTGSTAVLQDLTLRLPADLVMLSMPLSGEDGLALTRRLRQDGGAGIILIGSAATAAQRALGLEAGADDYLTAPLDGREVQARIRSVLRRLGERCERRPAWPAARFDGWRVDPGRRELRSVQGRNVSLTGAELDLLMALLSDPIRVIGREDLLERVAARDWHPDDRAIDQHISRLRRKLGDEPRNPRLIKTIRGRGYVLTAPVQWE